LRRGRLTDWECKELLQEEAEFRKKEVDSVIDSHFVLALKACDCSGAANSEDGLQACWHQSERREEDQQVEGALVVSEEDSRSCLQEKNLALEFGSQGQVVESMLARGGCGAESCQREDDKDRPRQYAVRTERRTQSP
jgi:hypothetical protein